MSFTYFIKSLIDAAGRQGNGFPLRKDLINMVLDYKDCVKACEHQHSKRSGPTAYYKGFYNLCKYEKKVGHMQYIFLYITFNHENLI